ncbi:MAG: XrtY-associated glycosyltransferase XYAG1 [Bacteroidia bacterium]
MSIKLLQITAAYKPAYIYGGPTMSVGKLCEALTSEPGIEVQVFTTTANGKTELPVVANKLCAIDGVGVTYFERITKDHTHFSPKLLWNLRREILKNRGLIIHIHAWWNLVSIFSCLIAKWYNIPILLSPRGMLTDYTANNRNAMVKSLIHKFIGKNLLEYCHIHTTGNKEEKEVLSIVTPKSITVIPNLVSFPIYLENSVKKVTSMKDQPFKLIFLSRIEEKKGLELLFEALVGVPFNWYLTIAGTGEEDYVLSLKNKTRDLGIFDKINWVGQVHNNDKFKLIANHDLLTLTSYNENFANVVVESLSVGTPVLLSNQVGLADYLTENDFGWVADLSCVSIRKNIIVSHESEKKRNTIRITAPKQIIIDFEPKNLIKKYINLYKEIIDVQL